MDLTTQAAEDYLKVIYELVMSDGRATTGAIAARLKVTPASATGMVQKLAVSEPPLVHYRKRWGAVLTPAGERRALQTIRQHRLLEAFLHQELGYSWDEVHDEAERLEHAISESFAARIEHFLDYPRRDPHGDPIPTRDLQLPARTTTTLAAIAPGETVVVQRVTDQEPDVLRELADMQVRPGIALEVVDREPLRISVEGQAHSLSPELAAHIHVAVRDTSQPKEESDS